MEQHDQQDRDPAEAFDVWSESGAFWRLGHGGRTGGGPGKLLPGPSQAQSVTRKPRRESA
jgi:hypothetical protein